MSSAASSPSADIWVAAGSRLLVSELSGIEMSARLSVNSNVCGTSSELSFSRNYQRQVADTSKSMRVDAQSAHSSQSAVHIELSEMKSDSSYFVWTVCRLCTGRRYVWSMTGVCIGKKRRFNMCRSGTGA